MLLTLGLVGCSDGSSSDTPDSGGVDSGDVDVDAAGGCGDSCQTGQACNANNECVYAETLIFSINETVLQTSATLDRSASMSACTFHASEFATAPPTPTAMEGACKVYTGSGMPPGIQTSFQGDAGTVKLKTSLLGEITLDTPTSEQNCYMKDLGTTTDVFTAGENITYSATGGAHVPMFSAPTKAPDPLASNAATVTRGQPVTITWSGAPSPNFKIWIFSSNNNGDYASIECAPPDNGSYTIPAAMTGYLRPDTTSVQLSMQRANTTLVQPAGSMVAVDLFASSTYLSYPIYNP